MKKRTSLVAICAAVAGMAAAPVFAAEISTNAALMQAMDKVTGRVNKITVPVNSKIAFGDFPWCCEPVKSARQKKLRRILPL